MADDQIGVEMGNGDVPSEIKRDRLSLSGLNWLAEKLLESYRNGQDAGKGKQVWTK